MDEEDQKKIAEALRPGKIRPVTTTTKVMVVVSAIGVAGMMIGFFLLSAPIGERPPALSVFSAMFWWALLLAFAFKAQARSMILGSVIGVVLGFLSWEAADIYAVYNQDEAWSIREAMKNTNAELPKMIDDEMRIDSVVISMELKTYAMSFTLVNYTAAEVDTEIINANFKEYSIPAFCEDEVLKIWLGRDYAVNVIYSDKLGEAIVKYSMTSSDC